MKLTYPTRIITINLKIKQLIVINQAFTKSSVRIVKVVILDKLVEIWKLGTKNT